MNNATAASDHVLVERSGAIVTLTFNRPEARNAMTWEMYERLYQTCEEVDGDDSIRVLVLKGAGGKAFVAGTDIGQFTEFKDGDDGLRYEREGDRRTFASPGSEAGDRADRGLRRRRRPRHRRRRRPSRRDARIALRRADRAHARQLPVDAGVRALPRPVRAVAAEGAHLHGAAADCRRGARRRFRPRDRRAEAIEARVRALAETVASHAPITLWVTKEAVRRIQEARTVPTATTSSPRPTAAPTSTKACAPSWKSARRAGPDARSTKLRTPVAAASRGVVGRLQLRQPGRMCASARRHAATEGSAKEAGRPQTTPRRCLSMVIRARC
jgi:enoyl-CoA hydratase/carnithine racemase